jgi:hypothetical protein
VPGVEFKAVPLPISFVDWRCAMSHSDDWSDNWKRILRMRIKCEAQAKAPADLESMFNRRLAEEPELYAFFRAEMSRTFGPGERARMERDLAELEADVREELS